VAELARAAGALTVAIVTRPFIFEGRPRMKAADEGLKDLRQHVDTLITIPNQRLLSIAAQETTYADAMQLADEVLVNATRGITDIILRSGDINVDFADVRAVMENRGNALMGCGLASGPDRAIQAAGAAIASPLLNDVNIDGAEAVLVNITGGEAMTLHEIADATSVIVDAAGEQANVILGTVVEPSLGDDIAVTLIATGFGEREKRVLPLRESVSPQKAPSPEPKVDVGPGEEPQPAAAVEAAAAAEEPLVAAQVAGDRLSKPEAPPAERDVKIPPSPSAATTAAQRRGLWQGDKSVSRDRPVFMKRQVE
jgi:cell division protein FtsZ